MCQRFIRPLKEELLCLHGFGNPGEAKHDIGPFVECCSLG